MRALFYKISFIIFLLIGFLGLFVSWIWWLFIIAVPLFLIGIYDIVQKKHTVLRNFPVIGHFRFMFEAIAPEIHQYFIEDDLSGRPIPRERRALVYRRAKGVLSTHPYGTEWNLNEIGYEWLNHSMRAHFIEDEDPRIIVGNEQCKQPYHASILNISAMSFGALSTNAILALNKGAKEGKFYHNTGEGGLSPYHLEPGGDIVWQIGTGYFGCRTPEGKFDPELFKERSRLPNVKMIEIKISQGAKPGHGGILPGAKVDEEIATIRGVRVGVDVISPPTHSAFSTPLEMMSFITQLRELSGGKPVGFKLCLGSRTEFFAICKAMLKTKVYPDFITVDGGEGGTGAAPIEFSNAIGTPLSEALVFIHNAIIGIGLRDKIRIIASGKLFTGTQFVTTFAKGADICNSARGMMLSLGCIQSLKCNTNRCPTGVATQDVKLSYGLVVEEKYKRVANFHKETVKAIMDMIGAAGLNHPSELKPYHIYRRIDAKNVERLDKIYPYIESGSLLKKPYPDLYAPYWEKAKAETFQWEYN